MVRGRCLFAFERKSPAFQAHAPAEQLDNLGAFSPAHVHQAHAAHPPGVPTLDELFGANQDVDRRMPGGDRLEKRSRKMIVLQLDGPLRVLFQLFDEGGYIADVDYAEVAETGGGAEPYFPVGLFDLRSLQGSGSLKHFL